ncbi:hypothetical protein PS874_04345 [Pseudomonas fluorescens]|nr:hypothetical protein PS874_04345 [Pseudomonas fluorescens]
MPTHTQPLPSVNARYLVNILIFGEHFYEIQDNKKGPTFR